MRKTLTELIAERRATTEVEVVDWGGAVTLARLPARDRLELLERISDKTNQDGELPVTIALDEYVWAISKSVANEGGDLVFDTDEGRKFLYGERVDVLVAVFQAVSDFNLGNLDSEIEAAKKN